MLSILILYFYFFISLVRHWFISVMVLIAQGDREVNSSYALWGSDTKICLNILTAPLEEDVGLIYAVSSLFLLLQSTEPLLHCAEL